MRELAQPVPRFLVTGVRDLDQEFEARLQDSASLAFRVAFSVLRHRVVLNFQAEAEGMGIEKILALGGRPKSRG